MDQPTATMIASIIAAAGSTAVGVVAVMSAARQNARTLRQQRQLAADERLGDRRIDLYVELMQLALSRVDKRPITVDPTDLRALLGLVNAFASDNVAKAFARIDKHSHLPARGGVEWQQDLRRLLIDLLQALRRELQPDSKHPGPPAEDRSRWRLFRRRRRALGG